MLKVVGAVAAPVVKHDDWQFAYAALQVIMQVVVAEVWANLFLAEADAAVVSPLIAKTPNRTAKLRITILPSDISSR